MAATAAKPAALDLNSVLGPGASFEGKLHFEGTVHINGNFRGEIFSNDDLAIGESARVEAEIDVGKIVIRGTVHGNIKAKHLVEIFPPGRVKGDIHTPSLHIERGVIFEGRSFMEELAAPKGAPAAQPVPPKPAPPTPVKP
jgi:cytoskeletal protein CcmA (bactofilin family)